MGSLGFPVKGGRIWTPPNPGIYHGNSQRAAICKTTAEDDKRYAIFLSKINIFEIVFSPMTDFF
jgi:hypothetical protein